MLSTNRSLSMTKKHIRRYPRICQGRLYWGWGMWASKRNYMDGWFPSVWSVRLEDLRYGER